MKKYGKLSGFTLIEVMLTLAIAGLIFLMMFIALPALQRSQRDTTRREDMTNLITAIKKYQSNNRGALPTGVPENIITYSSYSGASDQSTWAGLYRDYLGADFVDPSGGENYGLRIARCGEGLTPGAECNATKSDAIANVSDKTFPNGYTISVIISASCNGEQALATANPRKVAILYKLEGGGVYCGNT